MADLDDNCGLCNQNDFSKRGTWVLARGGVVPSGSVIGGQDMRRHLYVARAKHNGAILPGKLLPEYKSTYVSFGGEEKCCFEYEVLCGNFTNWQYASHGRVPPNAVPGGVSENGETLYIGRAMHRFSLAIGKVHPSKGFCYIPYGFEEHKYRNYEVLCY